MYQSSMHITVCCQFCYTYMQLDMCEPLLLHGRLAMHTPIASNVVRVHTTGHLLTRLSN